MASEFNVPYADVASQFPRDPQYFYLDYIHLSPEGDRLLAKLFSWFSGPRGYSHTHKRPAW